MVAHVLRGNRSTKYSAPSKRWHGMERTTSKRPAPIDDTHASDDSRWCARLASESSRFPVAFFGPGCRCDAWMGRTFFGARFAGADSIHGSNDRPKRPTPRSAGPRKCENADRLATEHVTGSCDRAPILGGKRARFRGRKKKARQRVDIQQSEISNRVETPSYVRVVFFLCLFFVFSVLINIYIDHSRLCLSLLLLPLFAVWLQGGRKTLTYKMGESCAPVSSVFSASLRRSKPHTRPSPIVLYWPSI